MRNLVFLLLTAARYSPFPLFANERKSLAATLQRQRFTGWNTWAGNMTVENGLIQTHGGMGLLYWTAGKLGDCRIRVVFKMRDHNDNSGVYIRIPLSPRA